MGTDVSNQDAARTVFAVASLLESQGANPYRVRAYRRAARSLMLLPDPLVRYTNEDGELALPWLGPSLRRRLGELAICGQLGIQLEILAALPRAQRELMRVPGVWPRRRAHFRNGPLRRGAVRARRGRAVGRGGPARGARRRRCAAPRRGAARAVRALLPAVAERAAARLPARGARALAAPPGTRRGRPADRRRQDRRRLHGARAGAGPDACRRADDRPAAPVAARPDRARRAAGGAGRRRRRRRAAERAGHGHHLRLGGDAATTARRLRPPDRRRGAPPAGADLPRDRVEGQRAVPARPERDAGAEGWRP